jgi:sporulation protein YlmC with PRC-barrel domain
LSKQTKEKSVTKDKLVGMKVISAEGKLLGAVKDVGFTIGKSTISLTIVDEKGETLDVPWDNIQGAVDFVVLKPENTPAAETVSTAAYTAASTVQQATPVQQQPVQQQPAQQQSQPTCKTCGGPLTYIPQYQRWYCYSCKKYA